MPTFGPESLRQLATCRQELQDVLNEVIKHVDCKVLEGHRGQELQDKYFREGKSQKRYPNGEHNNLPSNAVDVVPYPIDWNDAKRASYFAGIVIGIALAKGIKLRWGGDWDGDLNLREHSLFDTPHFEVIP